MPKATYDDSTSSHTVLSSSTALESPSLPTAPVAADSVATDTLAADRSAEISGAVLQDADGLLSAVAAPSVGVEHSPVWKVYCVECLADGRGYVGVTKRKIDQRMAAHAFLARRRPELGGPDSLAAAMRASSKAGVPVERAFSVRVVAETRSKQEARRLEQAWIAKLGTQRPAGFNIMPGGSLGGPANAVALSVDHPGKGTVTYASLMDAVTAVNSERTDAGQTPLRLYSVYMRRRAGWSIEQALGLAPHRDGRSQRAPFQWHGRTYHSLADLAKAEGLRIATARSRLHRAKIAGCGPDHDAAEDRRRQGSRRAGGVGCGGRPPLRLPDPSDPAVTVSARRFAELTQVPIATVLQRFHRVAAGQDPDQMPRDTLVAALTAAYDRSVVVTLELPDGRVITGAAREVIRKVLADVVLKWSRDEWIGFAAIRRRLRLVPGWPNEMAPPGVRWAFGFEPSARPSRVPALAE